MGTPNHMKNPDFNLDQEMQESNKRELDFEPILDYEEEDQAPGFNLFKMNPITLDSEEEDQSMNSPDDHLFYDPSSHHVFESEEAEEEKKEAPRQLINKGDIVEVQIHRGDYGMDGGKRYYKASKVLLGEFKVVKPEMYKGIQTVVIKSLETRDRYNIFPKDIAFVRELEESSTDSEEGVDFDEFSEDDSDSDSDDVAGLGLTIRRANAQVWIKFDVPQVL